jgi:hypothetical protein
MIKILKLSICVFVVLLISCKSTSSDKNISDSDERVVGTNKEYSVTENSKEKTKDSITEYWGDIAYFDSTVLSKKIYDYSNKGASHACLLAFDGSQKDSINMIGYHESYKSSLVKQKQRDGFYKIIDCEEQHFLFLFEDNMVNLRMVYEKDTTPKRYFRRIEKEAKDLQKYFAQNIFSGKYQNLSSGEIISFNSDMTVDGIDSVCRYEVLVDFLEMVPQMDIVYYVDDNNKYNAQLHWWFNNDTLFLQEAYSAYETDNGWVKSGVTGEILKYKIIN